MKQQKADVATYSGLGWKTNTGQRTAKWLLRAAVAEQLLSTEGQTWICKRPG